MCAAASAFYTDPLRVLLSSTLAGTKEESLPSRVMAPSSVIKPAVLCFQPKSRYISVNPSSFQLLIY